MVKGYLELWCVYLLTLSIPCKWIKHACSVVAIQADRQNTGCWTVLVIDNKYRITFFCHQRSLANSILPNWSPLWLRTAGPIVLPLLDRQTNRLTTTSRTQEKNIALVQSDFSGVLRWRRRSRGREGAFFLHISQSIELPPLWIKSPGQTW